MSALVERIIAARDGLKGLNISDYALVREARETLADAANGLDSYGKTMALIEEADRRVVDVLLWLDERGRNSRSFGSHADAYEIAARRLREALMGRSENPDGKTSSETGPNFSAPADEPRSSSAASGAQSSPGLKQEPLPNQKQEDPS